MSRLHVVSETPGLAEQLTPPSSLLSMNYNYEVTLGAVLSLSLSLSLTFIFSFFLFIKWFRNPIPPEIQYLPGCKPCAIRFFKTEGDAMPISCKSLPYGSTRALAASILKEISIYLRSDGHNCKWWYCNTSYIIRNQMRNGRSGFSCLLWVHDCMPTKFRIRSRGEQ